MTYNQIVSKVTGVLKSNNKDNRISRRFILSLLKSTAKQLISQKLLDRTIYNEENLYSTIHCFEMESIDKIQCPLIEMRSCNTLMRSKEKLPELVYSRLGSSIKEIISVDGEFQFILLSSQQIRRNKARQVKLKNDIYSYIDNEGYLYIADKEIYTVDITLLTMDTEELDKMSSCSNGDGDCKSNWTYEFICPDKLLDVVLQQTLSMLGMSKSIQQDQNPNGVENA